MALDFQRIFMKNLPTVNERWKPVLPRLVDKMIELGYTREACDKLFPGGNLIVRDFVKVPGYLRNCREAGGPLAVLVPFFLLRRLVDRKALEGVIGEELVECLLGCNLILQDGDQVEAIYDLYPCYGSYIFTDSKFQRASELSPLTTYYLGNDSYALARVTPRQKVRRALDLCTGSGVHSVMAARHANLAMAVDLNPRAIAVSELNAVLNRQDEICGFMLGDLYGPIAKGGFDLITANPPFIPTPQEDMELYRSGGESGEEVTERIFRDLPKYLAPGGLLSLVTNFPITRAGDILERHQRWLGDPKGWGLLLLNFGVITREQYVLMQYKAVGDYEQDFAEMDRWLDLYERLGILSLSFGIIMVRRLETEDSWLEFRNFPGGAQAMSDEFEAFLESLTFFNSAAFAEGWAEFVPRPRPVKAFYTDRLAGVGRVEFRHPEWPAVDLAAEETALLSKIYDQPGRPASELTDGPELLKALGRHNLILPEGA